MIHMATIATYASTFAGRPVTIVCQKQARFDTANGLANTANLAPGDHLAGFTVELADGTIAPVVYLPNSTCHDLEHLDTGNAIFPSDMLTLTHELEHIVLQSGNECDVEKAALANEWSLLKLFKISSWRDHAIIDNAKTADSEMPTDPYRVGCTS